MLFMSPHALTLTKVLSNVLKNISFPLYLLLVLSITENIFNIEAYNQSL